MTNDAYLNGADLSGAYLPNITPETLDALKMPLIDTAMKRAVKTAEVTTLLGFPIRTKRYPVTEGDALSHCMTLRSTRDLQRLSRTAVAPQVRIAAYGALLDRYQTYQCVIVALAAALLTCVLVLP